MLPLVLTFSVVFMLGLVMGFVGCMLSERPTTVEMPKPNGPQYRLDLYAGDIIEVWENGLWVPKAVGSIYNQAGTFGPECVVLQANGFMIVKDPKSRMKFMVRDSQVIRVQ